jgi:peptidoglycan/LPS O-acetylase OafA/YrhL
MRSSSGAHYIALDHVRALAAFIVFTWHFTHASNGYPVPFDYVPALFPFSILDEGHTGVALFMTLSGYLFAKLLDGKSIDYGAFIWNRGLRLLPLLTVVILIVGITQLVSGQRLSSYAYSILTGVLLPSLPNGGWSITAEFHYYLILPLFLWMFRKSKSLPVSIIIMAVALRLFLYHEKGEIQSLAYPTIVGRIDQFALGMLAYQFRSCVARRHLMALLTITAFMMIYWYFDSEGGFYQNPSYPSPSPFWIFLPTLEGIAYAIGIAWYDNSFSHSTSRFSRFIGRIGEYSYSIYLLHFFVVFGAARFVNEHIMDISNFYLACLWSLVFFVSMVVPGYISFRFIEAPFLKLRKCYIRVPRGRDDVQRGAPGDAPQAVVP